MSMEESRMALFFLCICVFVSSLQFVLSASPPICPLRSPSFIDHLQAKCPIFFSSNSPLEVNGYYLDRTLKSMRGNMYTSVLFYASWCPFSHDARLAYEALSSMFPQIEHLAVEQSAAMPSIFSRYGIHSLPAILMVNQTSRVRFRGSKDLRSLVRFYLKITGFEPVHSVDVDLYAGIESSEKLPKHSWIGSSLYELSKREPYLLFSMLFICLRILVAVFPKIISRLRAFWVLYVPQLKLEIFGETSQMLGRVLNMIDVKRIWAKLRFCKTRNFQEGAKNARVWASSLASVSLGEASSSRS